MIAALTIILLLKALPTAAAKKKESKEKGSKPGTEMEYSIELVDYSIDGSTATFTYRVESGDNPAIKQWELFSDLFTEKSILSASEKVSVNPSKGRLRFIEHYEPGEVRKVTFTLSMNGYYYYSVSVAKIPFNVRSPPLKESGMVDGPGFPGDIEQLAAIYNLGTVLSLSATSILAALAKVGILTVTNI